MVLVGGNRKFGNLCPNSRTTFTAFQPLNSITNEIRELSSYLLVQVNSLNCTKIFSSEKFYRLTSSTARWPTEADKVRRFINRV